MELSGKKVIVTGGAGGIGQGIISELVKAGAKPGVLDANAAKLKELQGTFKDIWTAECDVTDAGQLERALGGFMQARGPIDVLVNNAGLIYSAPLVAIGAEGVKRHAIDAWEKVLTANLSSVFHVTVQVAESMLRNRTKGVIINVSSISAAGNAGQSAYAAAKAGVNALTVTWARELGPLGIRVAGIAPGFTDTPSTHGAMAKETLEAIKKTVPLKRLGTAAEIAGGVLFLIQNDFFHGKILEVDGGLNLP